jgi:hypothetical protein
MDSKIEHIIKNYQYFELDEAQKKLIADWAENSDEFEALQSTLLVTDQFVKSQEDDLNPTIKQRLDVRFAEKHDHHRLVWYNKLWLFLWPNESPFYKRPLIQFAAICLVIVSTIPFFPDVRKQQLAMNDVKTNEKVEDEEKVSTKNEEVLLEEPIDEVSEAEQEQSTENEMEVSNNRNAETKDADESILKANQEGWKLNEEQVAFGSDSRSAGTEDALEDVPNETYREEVSYSYDEKDRAAPAIESLSIKSLMMDAEAPIKKVETKETIDLLTALY